MVKKISEDEFEEVRKQAVALVDFSATWCGPCKMIAPVLEEVSEQMDGKIAFYNVDVDENPNLAREYNIMSIPALVLLKEGKVANTHVGFVPKDAILTFLNA